MLPFSISLRTGSPVSEQVIYAVTRAAVSGELQPGDPFPSVRALSQELENQPEHGTQNHRGPHRAQPARRAPWRRHRRRRGSAMQAAPLNVAWCSKKRQSTWSCRPGSRSVAGRPLAAIRRPLGADRPSRGVTQWRHSHRDGRSVAPIRPQSRHRWRQSPGEVRQHLRPCRPERRGQDNDRQTAL